VKAGRSVRILNHDAHPDVRMLENGLGHSGSPFSQAIMDDSGLCASYTVVGLNPHSVSRVHLDFVRENKGEYLFRDEVSSQTIARIHEGLREPSMVSFDLDAVDQAHAPGVSAPSALGLSPDLWLFAAEAAGANPAVQSMDLVEFNPNYDTDQRTARLAALTIWRFLRGLCRRGGSRP
jgi:formiminoglutamase